MLNLQDIFLNQIRKDKTMVTVYLINGFQLPAERLRGLTALPSLLKMRDGRTCCLQECCFYYHTGQTGQTDGRTGSAGSTGR